MRSASCEATSEIINELLCSEHFECLELPVPSVEMSLEIVKMLLKRSAKSLEQGQTEELAERLHVKSSIRNPLTLSVLSEELRMQGNFEARVAATRCLLNRSVRAALVFSDSSVYEQIAGLDCP